MLLSQDRVTTIFTVKFRIDNITFTIKKCFEGRSNWNIKFDAYPVTIADVDDVIK